MYGEHEYPREKVPGMDGAGGSQAGGTGRASSPPIPEAQKLDIQRLATLPPPYPRRYPAVNNNYPNLADVRAVICSLYKLSDITAAHDVFTAEKVDIMQKTESPKANSCCSCASSTHCLPSHQ